MKHEKEKRETRSGEREIWNENVIRVCDEF